MSSPSPDLPRSTTPLLAALTEIFYASPASHSSLGEFREIAAENLPDRHRQLLAHCNHMTVTVEAFHRSSVDVQVLQVDAEGDCYSRKILLTRQSDNQVVQFGIVRLHWQFLSETIRREVEAERLPLGRVLIEHKVHRNVELATLWQITPGEELRQHLSVAPEQSVYGRTALIYCNGLPAIELLEIVP